MIAALDTNVLLDVLLPVKTSFGNSKTLLHMSANLFQARLSPNRGQHTLPGLVIALALLLNLVGTQGLAAEISPTKVTDGDEWMQSNSTYSTPITVTTQVRFSENETEELQGVWLAGLLAESNPSTGEAPLALGLTWAPASLGWFGSLWGLHIQTELGLIPQDSSPKSGSEFLAGSVYITLDSSQPQLGHTYEAALGYNPLTGAASVAVTDLTTGDRILEQGLALNRYSGSLRPDSGLRLGYQPGESRIPGNIARPVALQVAPVMVPFALKWNLWQLGKQGDSSPTTNIDRSKETFVKLSMPWDEIHGTLLFTVSDGRDVTLVAKEEHPRNNGLVALPLKDLPAGPHYRLILQYADQGQTWTLGEIPFTVGVVTAKLENIQLTPFDNARLQVAGSLHVQADGSISNVGVGLDLAFYKDILKLDSDSKQGTITGEKMAVQPILSEKLAYVFSDKTSFDFSVTLPIPPDSSSYQSWQAELSSWIDAPVNTQTDRRTKQFRINPANDEIAPGNPTDIKVMTYNIRHGQGTDMQVDLGRIADVIALSGADIVGLNEVDDKTDRSGRINQPAELAKMFGMHVVFGPNITYQNGLYGNAVLSRFPILSWRNIPMQNPRYGMLEVVVDVDGAAVRFYTTHLSLVEEEQAAQLKQIRQIVTESTEPVIFSGDLNSLADTARDPGYVFAPELRDVWRLETGVALGTDKPLPQGSATGYTFNSAKLDRRIDFIFINKHLELTNTNPVYTILSPASDHIPFVVHVRIAKER